MMGTKEAGKDTNAVSKSHLVSKALVLTESWRPCSAPESGAELSGVKSWRKQKQAETGIGGGTHVQGKVLI